MRQLARLMRLVARLFGSGAGVPAVVVRPPVERFGKLTAAEADTLRARAEIRRAAAAAKYSEGHSIRGGNAS